ncbi:MAG: hypothetical protein KC561_08925 [Myxococcales bacterium]|nr:hypothetical protein [Myxococcales bacterium]
MLMFVVLVVLTPVLAYMATKRSPWLIAVWIFLGLAVPLARVKVGPVSLYLGEYASAFALLAFWRPPTNEVVRRADIWYTVLVGVLIVGVLSSALRYGHFLEPTYLFIRYIAAMVPLIIIPRVIGDQRFAKAAMYGLILTGLTYGATAAAQSSSRELAILVDNLYQIMRQGSSDEDAFLRSVAIVRGTSLRAYGFAGGPNLLAGSAFVVTALLANFRSLYQVRFWTNAAIGASVLALGLSYSRHGLLALAVTFSVLIMLQPRRFARLAGVALLALAVASFFISESFWLERLGRGGITQDENIYMRLVQRPLELLVRIEHDPMLLVAGNGFGFEWFLSGDELRAARFGFVSNSFLLYLFYTGLASEIAYIAFFIRTALHTRFLPRSKAAVALATWIGIAIIMASDNYGFTKHHIPFGWCFLAAYILAHKEPARYALGYPRYTGHSPVTNAA